jgi:hypothetical protein
LSKTEKGEEYNQSWKKSRGGRGEAIFRRSDAHVRRIRLMRKEQIILISLMIFYEVNSLRLYTKLIHRGI